MTLRLNNDIIDDQLGLIIDAMDAATSPGKFLILDGTQPAKGGSLTNTLAVFEMNEPFATVVSHALDIDLPADTVGLIEGVATWGRWVDGNGSFVADATAGSDFTLNVSLIEVGGAVKMLAASIGSIN